MVSASFLAVVGLFLAAPVAAQGEQPPVEPVSLARAGSEPTIPNWIDGGPVVPMLAAFTVAMLVGGLALVALRCRSNPTQS